jgi:hypothetical protein
VRLVTSDFSFQACYASSIFNRVEDIDPGGAAADDIGEAEAPFRKAPILPIGQGFTDQLRFMQEPPKSIRIPGKMVAGLC